MTLDVLQKEMISAMKSKDKIRKETISSIIGNVKTAAINEGCRNNIPETLVDRIVLKEKKTMQEMIDTCPTNRIDILNEYNQKMLVIKEFVPNMMSEEEIRKIINELIKGAASINKGLVMKTVVPVFKGKADMKLVNQIVSEICSKVDKYE